MNNTTIISSPLGNIQLLADENGVYQIEFTKKHFKASKTTNTHLMKAAKELKEYFDGHRKNFTFTKHALSGTSFQKKVWNALEKIPYGTTCAYSDIAKKIGRPLAARAIGSACNKNPIGIVVPCHRVVGKSGKLTGYAGGLHFKEWLLNHENAKL